MKPHIEVSESYWNKTGEGILGKYGKSGYKRNINLAEWFRNDRGLILYGKYRTGKTLTAKIIQKAYYQTGFYFKFWSVFELIDVIRREGMYGILQPMIIDDLGKEPVNIKNYGTEEAPIQQLLFELSERAIPFIVTTNKDVYSEDFKRRYTMWIYNRLIEFNDIKLVEKL